MAKKIYSRPCVEANASRLRMNILAGSVIGGVGKDYDFEDETPSGNGARKRFPFE
ncbi:MAG: hypothetical protein J6Y15_08850 [Bacteroidaceae bacterium]|nr:hypothetical protein [Bacteroidaceae bacterium]